MRILQLLIAILATSRICFPADLAPTLQWVKAIGGSGLSTVTAAAADSSGALYIVGTTSSIDFPVAAPAQQNAGGSTLVRINTATGAADKIYTPGYSTITSIAADPRNPQTLYAGAANIILRSADAGSTWSQLSALPSGATARFLTVDPAGNNAIYAATNQGILRSTNGGVTWAASNDGIVPPSNGTLNALRIWVDPRSSTIVFASVNGRLLRSSNSGGSWTEITSFSGFFGHALTFDPLQPGTLYAACAGPNQMARSTDGGQTFQPLPGLPDQGPANTLAADPFNKGVIYAGTYSGIYESVDSGVTWSRKTSGQSSFLAADPNNPAFYSDSPTLGILKTADAFRTTSPVGPQVILPLQILVAGPNVFEVSSSGTDVFAVKLDPDGNVVYSTYFGGSAQDTAAAMALGPDGSLYVTGATTSADFPATPGVYKTARPADPGNLASFVFKLNSDGSLGWSTYFADPGTTVKALAVDSAGNPFIGGSTSGNLPTTPGAYQTQFKQTLFCTGFIGCFPGPASAFVTKFNSQGAGLLYSTYVFSDDTKNAIISAQALVADPSGNAWFGGSGNVVGVNPTGSALVASTYLPQVSISAVALDSSLNLYATGKYTPNPSPGFQFPATSGAFQTAPQPAIPTLPYQSMAGGGADAFVIKWNGSLSQILAATLLGGELEDYGESIAIDPAGNVMVSGKTDSKAFPIRAPFQTSFAPRAGFVAALDPNLSHLLFSTYLGDRRAFDAAAVTPDGHGNLLLAGSTLSINGNLFVGGQPGQSFNGGGLVVANKIALPAASAVRLDSVRHFASQLAGSLAPGEPILAIGSGFGADARLLINGVPLDGVTGTSTTLVAVMPDTAATSGDLRIQVSTGGALSNPVFVPAAPASPGIYSVDGSGYGQGYILNSDGTLNSPANPAVQGSAITIFAAGVGALSLDNGYAVTALPPAVFVEGFYAKGIAAVAGPVAGLPGNVYQLSVLVPDIAELVTNNPDLKTFKFPPQVGVKLIIGTVGPLNPDSSVMISQGGIVLNVK